MKVLLEIRGFDLDRVEMIQMHISIQKHGLGGGVMPCEFDRIEAVEAFKELGEGVVIMRPEDHVINKIQPETELLGSGMK